MGCLITSLKNKKGFTLVEVMVAVAAMGGLALVLMQISKTQNQTLVQSQVDADVSQLKTEIQALLNNPAHCNANFFNKTPTSPAPTEIYKCSVTTSGACSGGGGTPTPQSTLKPNPTNWIGTYSTRVKITALTLNVTPMQVPGGSAPLVLTNATLGVTLQKKYTDGATKTESINFNNTAVYDGTKIVGCPRSWNSTLVY